MDSLPRPPKKIKQDTPLGFAIRKLDLKLDTLPERTSAWTAPQKSALLQMCRIVIDEYHKENDNADATQKS